MTTDAERWDEKYRGMLAEERPPDPFVEQALDRLGSGADKPAVDVACGLGRHTRSLLRRGYTVEAWDVSAVGLEQLEQRLQNETGSFLTRQVDVGQMASCPQRFELVLVADFLHRPLFSQVESWLAPGGHFLMVTFTQDHPAPKPGPQYRLEPGELARSVPELRTLWYEEVEGRAGLLAVRTS